jgi:hypothetical protein
MSVSVVGIGDEVQEKREFAARHLKRETEMRLFSLPFQIVVTITTAIYQQEPIVWHPLEHSRPISCSCSSQHRTFQIRPASKHSHQQMELSRHGRGQELLDLCFLECTKSVWTFYTGPLTLKCYTVVLSPCNPNSLEIDHSHATLGLARTKRCYLIEQVFDRR